MSAKKAWYISDSHFGHAKFVEVWKDVNGNPMRPFETVLDMDLYMIQKWNETVKHEDKVYFLGDFCIRKENLKYVRQLNGRKILIQGNHDAEPVMKYIEAGFDDVRAYYMFEGMLLSHYPVHPNSIKDKWLCNLHGHCHSNIINSPRHLNVSVEQVGYTPINVNEISKRVQMNERSFKKTGKVINFSEIYNVIKS